MKWRIYNLYIGATFLQSILLPVGATESQVKEKALHDLEAVPGVICDYPNEAPCERRAKINAATVHPEPREFERTTERKYWGFIPAGLRNDPPQPECPWATARREQEAARKRAMARRARALYEQNNPPEDLGPAI